MREQAKPPATGPDIRRQQSLQVLSRIFDAYTCNLIQRAMAEKARDKTRTQSKLCLADLTRQAATAAGIDYRALNAWLVNTFVDEKLLAESEVIE